MTRAQKRKRAREKKAQLEAAQKVEDALKDPPTPVFGFSADTQTGFYMSIPDKIGVVYKGKKVL